MKKWILALVCTIAAGAAAGGLCTWAVQEAEMEALERQGCNLVIGNESEDVVYAVSVSYEKDGELRQAVNSQYMQKGSKACFSIDPVEDLRCVVRIQMDNHQMVVAELEEDFEWDDMNVCWLTGEDGEYVLSRERND